MFLYVFSTSFLPFLFTPSISIPLLYEGIQNEMTRSSLNTTAANNLGIRCHQSMYGRPEVESCNNAATLIGLDRTAKAFRQRHDSRRADFELPVTYISGQRPGALYGNDFAAL